MITRWQLYKSMLAGWIADRLPDSVVHWACVRVFAHASQVHSDRHIGSLTPAECLKAWGQRWVK